MGDELLVSTLVPVWLKVAWTAMVLVIVSLTACMVLVAEMLWSVSFFGRLLRLPRVTRLADYMFEQQSPLRLRAVSLLETNASGYNYTLSIERRFDHPPEKVWRVITEREPPKTTRC